MQIHRLPLGQMQANCYILEDEGKAILIDPADTADFILEKIAFKRLELVGIIATHGHFDHVMAVGEIQMSYPHLPLYIHSKEEFLFKRLPETAKHFLGYDPIVLPIGKRLPLTKGTMTIENFTFDVIETPGHTPGSVSIYFKDYQIIFTGDTLFQGSVGRYDFSYSDKNELKKSIEKILALPRETIVYSGHGEETRIEYEKDTFTQFFG